MRLTAFLKLYKMCTLLLRSNLKIFRRPEPTRSTDVAHQVMVLFACGETVTVDDSPNNGTAVAYVFSNSKLERIF